MKKITWLLFWCCPLWGFAQNNPATPAQLQKTYVNYFKYNREAVYLQLNKTQVIPGESIWFSAYVFDPRTQKPNLKTTNLHVNLYNQQGKLLAAKTVYIEKGKGQGYFKLDTTHYNPGKYLIRAFTNYMRNFKEENDFRQGFVIIGNTDQAPSTKIKYDLQVLPEGGHLLENTQNTLGVKLINNQGEGVAFTHGKVRNTEGKVVTTFQSNPFGLSKFRLFYNAKEHYKVSVVTSSRKTVTVNMPIAEKRGLVFSVNNLTSHYLYLSIHTNKASLPRVGGKKYYIVIHREGVMGSIPFVFPTDTTAAILRIDKGVLANGINIITLFNQKFHPLLERQVFYGKNITHTPIYATLIGNSNDSLLINLNAEIKGVTHRLSVSVLPAKTKAYTPKNNILSAFYIEPFIKGDLENGAYYFASNNARQRNYNLDLLLLTQGWSKYAWKNIFSGPPTIYYQPEHGFSLSGSVNEPTNNGSQSIMIKGEKGNRLFQVAKLNTQNQFTVNHLYIENGEWVSFGLMGSKKGKISTPKIYTRISPLPDTKNLTHITQHDFVNLNIPPKKIKNIIQYTHSLPRHYSAQILDTINIKARPNPKNLHSDRRTSTIEHFTKIDKITAAIYPYITDFIATKGYAVQRSVKGVTISTLGATSMRGPGHPLVIVDGMALTGSNDMLVDLRTSDVTSIAINKIGARYGMRGANGAIVIKTKSGSFSSKKGKPSETTRALKMQNGFAQEKSFYTPLYHNYNSEPYKNYGAIGWFPAIKLSVQSGIKTLRIPNTHQDAVKLFIEGMASNGTLISEVLTIKTP